MVLVPSDSNTVYFGCDGGIWKSINAGANFTDLNNTTFSATQFQSIALHPVDRFFSIGETQDNCTEFLRPDNSWVRAIGDDGGQSVLDQNATDNINVTMYHTFFNQTNSQIGFDRISSVNPTWTPFSNGLPRVAVFDMAIHKTQRLLRIATHGRGIFEMNLRQALP